MDRSRFTLCNRIGGAFVFALGLVLVIAPRPAAAAIIVQDLFDGVANGNYPLNGQNDTTTVLGLTGTWSGYASIYTANNFNVLAGYGPASNAGQVGGLWWNSSNNWSTSSYAQRAMTSSINLGQAATYYLSFKGVRGSDAAEFVGFSDTSGDFINVGCTWSNANRIGTSGNNAYQAGFIGHQIPVELRTRPATTCVPLFRGLGNKI